MNKKLKFVSRPKLHPTETFKTINTMIKNTIHTTLKNTLRNTPWLISFTGDIPLVCIQRRQEHQNTHTHTHARLITVEPVELVRGMWGSRNSPEHIPLLITHTDARTHSHTWLQAQFNNISQFRLTNISNKTITVNDLFPEKVQTEWRPQSWTGGGGGGCPEGQSPWEF